MCNKFIRNICTGVILVFMSVSSADIVWGEGQERRAKAREALQAHLKESLGVNQFNLIEIDAPALGKVCLDCLLYTSDAADE